MRAGQKILQGNVGAVVIACRIGAIDRVTAIADLTSLLAYGRTQTDLLLGGQHHRPHPRTVFMKAFGGTEGLGRGACLSGQIKDLIAKSVSQCADGGV